MKELAMVAGLENERYNFAVLMLLMLKPFLFELELIITPLLALLVTLEVVGVRVATEAITGTAVALS